MNRNLLRGLLYGIGFSLPIWGLALSFFTGWYWVPMVAGALLVIATGLVDWCADDVGYSETVYGDVASQLVHTPSHATTIIDGGRQPAWRDDILRRDPLAYPLTKRATWPNQVGAPE